MVTKFTHRQLKDVLMEPEAKGIEEPYFIIHAEESNEDLIVLSGGKNGSEFNKTHGFFLNFHQILIYRCLYGGGILLLQKNDENGEAKEVRIITLRPGVETEVPSSWGHTVINTSKNFLVLASNIPDNEDHIDTESMKEKQGLAYYVIDRKGEIGFEKNHNYAFHPQIINY